MSYKTTMSPDKQDVVLQKLAEIAQTMSGGQSLKKKAGLSIADKERVINSLLSDPTGRGLVYRSPRIATR